MIPPCPEAAWRREGTARGWPVPVAPAWKRAPVVRHLRAALRVLEVPSVALLDEDRDRLVWTAEGVLRGYEDEPVPPERFKTRAPEGRAAWRSQTRDLYGRMALDVLRRMDDKHCDALGSDPGLYANFSDEVSELLTDWEEFVANAPPSSE